jgi:NAD(P)-dependent dehydrogenase (short-subunit alcohol dehydrogenase family)
VLKFDGRVAIVTGAGAGMGRAHALALAARGARVVVNDVSAEDAHETTHQIESVGGTALVDIHDVSSDAAAIVEAAVTAFGGLHIVVSNAGIIRTGMFTEQAPEDFWKVFDVSFKGTVDLSRASWPHLVSSGTGRLILVSSSGILGNPTTSAYSAAKGAIWSLANVLAMEGDMQGVQVSALMPTAWTPMTENAYSDPVVVETLRDRMGPEHVAAFVAFLAHQDTTVHGDLYQVSGGRASAMRLAGLPRVEVSESSPEGWVEMSDHLANPTGRLEPYRTTGDQFAAEMIAANPAVAEFLRGSNPADPTS